MIEVICYSIKNNLNEYISLPDPWHLQPPVKESHFLPEKNCNLQFLPIVS